MNLLHAHLVQTPCTPVLHYQTAPIQIVFGCLLHMRIRTSISRSASLTGAAVAAAVWSLQSLDQVLEYIHKHPSHRSCEGKVRCMF